MQIFPMRSLLFSSCLLGLISCNTVFKNLSPATGDVQAITKFKPTFTVALYKTQVDVIGNYLSGLLLVKKMPDSSTRMLFSNEMGIKFFDFGFFSNGDFKVYYIIKKMNRKAVIKTLRKDFQLLLMEPLDTNTGYILTDTAAQKYFIFPQSKGYNYYITDSAVNVMKSMERASKKKSVVTVYAGNYVNGLPDTIGITHHTFDFQIRLKRIEKE